jgi:meso-butanediol dehydrogenase/(S,S)-butanediol dehydrogenase/diacetyl reductase
MRLANQVALVTGGGSGIGRAISLRFAREGAAIVVADLKPERAAETAKLVTRAGGKATAVTADVSKADQVQAMAEAAVAAFGRVDILVNNAGLSVGDTVLDFDEAAWDLNLDVVLKSVYLCSRTVLPGMIARGHGVILNIASVNGIMAVGEAAYSAAKAGMINLTANLAIHFGDQGIRVNCVAPGTIRTPIWGARVARDPHVFEKIAPWYPLGRVGEPEDVANAALFLCSDEASWITGVTLPVDGGLTAGSYRLNRDLQGM